MDIATKSELITMIDLIQKDHPIASITQKYVENTLQRHSASSKDKSHKHHSLHEKKGRHRKGSEKSDKSERSEKSDTDKSN